MNKVYISILNPILNSYTSATIDDPVNIKDRISNALRYFGISDVIWSNPTYTVVPTSELRMATQIGVVKETSKIVTISYYEEPLPF